MKTEFFEDLLRRLGLQCAELEFTVGVTSERETHPGIAPVADSVKDDDSLMPSPLMLLRVELAVHLYLRIRPYPLTARTVLFLPTAGPPGDCPPGWS